MKANQSQRVFDTTVHVITILFMALCLLPFLHEAAISLSSNSAIISGKVLLWPREFTLQSYQDIFADPAMTGSLLLTVQVTAVYTLIAMIMTIAAAFPLAQKRMRGQKFFMFVMVFTMFFSGGMIPDYLLIKDLRLLNTVWALILPLVINTFNLIIMRTFFMSIPDSLVESARLDGCSDWGILTKIVLPLSMPVIATLSLFYAVAKWNSFQDALFYISEPKLFPVQLKIYNIIMNSMAVDVAVQEGSSSTTNALPDSLKAAAVMFATLPIVVVYPWLQKYFIKGVMVGAIKG